MDLLSGAQCWGSLRMSDTPQFLDSVQSGALKWQNDMSLLQIVVNSRQWRKYTLNIFTCKFESRYLQTRCISLAICIFFG